MTEHKYEEASGRLRWKMKGEYIFSGDNLPILQNEIVIYDVTQPYLVEIGREWRDVPIEVEA